MRSMILVLFGLAAPGAAFAQTHVTVPPVVATGLDSLARGQCQAAIDLWSVDWPDLQKAQIASTCTTLPQAGGDLHGYDLLRSVEVTPHLTRVYVVLLYEAQPVYMMLVAYRPDAGAWKVETINWNTDPDKVIPTAILPPQRPGS